MTSGLQAERTELAWLRTMLSSWATTLIALKVVFPAGVLSLIAPVALTVIACGRRRRLKGAGSPPALHRGVAAAVAGACALVAVAVILR